MEFKLISADNYMKMRFRHKLDKWHIPYLVKTINNEEYIELHPRCCFYDVDSDFKYWDKDDYNGHDPQQDFCYIHIDFVDDLKELSNDFEGVKLIINFEKATITLYNHYVE